MFNGGDLTGWQGLLKIRLYEKMKPAELAKKQAEADKVPLNWSVKDGCIWFNGRGDNLCSIKQYADFELLADWKITKEGQRYIPERNTTGTDLGYITCFSRVFQSDRADFTITRQILQNS